MPSNLYSIVELMVTGALVAASAGVLVRRAWLAWREPVAHPATGASPASRCAGCGACARRATPATCDATFPVVVARPRRGPGP